ncbi:MAG: formate dehydrogenase subunit gamma [Steroidobacteraceae bacterium]
MFDTQPSRDELLALIEPCKDQPGPLLVMLHAIQRRIGYVPASAIPVLASELNLSRAEVQGVVSFYHHFRDRPPAKRSIEVCRAESCQALQGDRLTAHIEQRTGLRVGETSADGSMSLHPVYCLGLCSASPALTIDGAVHARVTPERFDELIAQPGSKR